MKTLTIISGGTNGVDLEAQRFARDFGLPVHILVPPCHPQSKYLSPLTHSQLGEAIPITNQVSARLNKPLSNPITLQYIHRNCHVVKQAEMNLSRPRVPYGTRLYHPPNSQECHIALCIVHDSNQSKTYFFIV